MTANREARVLRSTRLRLVAWSGGSTLVVLVALGLGIHATVAGSLAAQHVDRLEARGTELKAMIESRPIGVMPFVGQQFLAGNPREPGLVVGGPTSGTFGIIIADDDGVPMIGGPVADLGLPNQAGIDAALAGEATIRDVVVRGIPGRILSVPVSNGAETFVVQVFSDRIAEESTLATLRSVLLAGGVGVLAAALVVGWLYAGRALIPIRRSLERQRAFAADASHELRTPLAVVRSSVDELRRVDGRAVGSRHALDDIDAGVSRLTSLVDDLLLLARADSGALEIVPERTDLSEAAADALDDLGPLAAQRQVRLGLDAEPAIVDGDPRRLRQLVAILVDNAIQHGPQGGGVDVGVRIDDGVAQLTVRDEGAGIPVDQLPHVFDRFWRAPGAPAGGTGLGLAIAAWISDRHGGSIRAENVLSGGARFVVRLPRGNGS